MTLNCRQQNRFIHKHAKKYVVLQCNTGGKNMQEQITEPLAKFHAKVTRGGQFTSSSYTKTIL